VSAESYVGDNMARIYICGKRECELQYTDSLKRFLEQRPIKKEEGGMKYRVVEELCVNCTIRNGCILTNIPEGAVFKNIVSGKLFAFVHDVGDCGGLMEVEPQEEE
jgi:hypothetical protein